MWSQLITNLRWKILAFPFNYKQPDLSNIPFRLEFTCLHVPRSHMTGRAFCSYAIFYMLWLFLMMGFLLLLIVANIFLRSNCSFILIYLNTIGRSSLGEVARCLFIVVSSTSVSHPGIKLFCESSHSCITLF